MASRPARLLAISLHNPPWFDETYAPLLTAIRSKAEFQRAEDSASALRFLSQQPEPTAILITDEALTLHKNRAVWEAVLDYVSRGGVAVVMGLFSSFVKPNKIKPFFSKPGLPWGAGSYHRTTLILNQAVVDAASVEKLAPSYSQKALFVNNVVPGDMWYRTDQDSVVESRVFPPDNAHTPGETAVALAKVGQGRLGYVGDVNAEAGSNAVVLAMCGLL
ncbi:hypothetical protein XA68_11398 [Ophiocordyceps unilateralis]|uniref:Triacylglycerol lipase n=1 Tax=Ophiocordyceps unilateralis TaxID=268505 RepID=A0A2A9PF60_OPHUN|nr:hypothetical protein XA68_11398 [Ophiocordyceps unilateralis]